MSKLRFGSTHLAALFFLLGRLALAQSTAPQISVTFPGGMALDGAQISYMMEGEFGGVGGSVETKPETRSYVIAASVEGKPARDIKIVVYAPGCEFQIFHLSLLPASTHQISPVCTKVHTARVWGHVEPQQILSGPPAHIQVLYMAEWMCSFYGLADCMVAQYKVATATLDGDRNFSVELPGFEPHVFYSSDRSSSGYKFILREDKTGNIRAWLTANEYQHAGGDLEVRSSYPSLIFTARK